MRYGSLIIASLIALSFISGCSPPQRETPSELPSPSALVSGAPSPAPSESEKPGPVAIRYAELQEKGHPQAISQEFVLAELVKEAPAMFDYETSYGNLSLYSDQPFDKTKAINILIDVDQRLKTSPIFDKNVVHRAFICNETWREELFLQGAGRIGGLNHFPTARHVFLTKARVEDDALLSPRGRPIAEPRSLSYYLAHEFTHTLIGDQVGVVEFNTMPRWLAEGYPDYVALGPNYSYQKALESYQNRDPRVHGTLAEDYLRYGVLVAYALERQRTEVTKLFENPPNEKALGDLALP